ncbi:MAG: DoxX family protein [Acidiferrobacteraceae bacterium]
MSRANKDHRGADAAAFILRGAIGPMMVAHGMNKVRGPGGLEGTTRYFESLGLQPAHVHARVAAATEITTGTVVTLGAMTPLASAGIIGVMTSAAATDHKGKGFFIFKGGWEYVAVVGAAAGALSALGPGRLSVDAARGKGQGGLARALFSTALGVGAAALMLGSSRKDPETATDAASGPGTDDVASGDGTADGGDRPTGGGAKGERNDDGLDGNDDGRQGRAGQ